MLKKSKKVKTFYAGKLVQLEKYYHTFLIRKNYVKEFECNAKSW